jgi:glutaryl-CoA dehydrogenase (non-decarboxylating)
MELAAEEVAAQEAFRLFVDRDVAPFADQFDDEGRVSEELIAAVGTKGYLGANISRAFNGQAMDAVMVGLLCEQLGRGSCSVLSLLIVHGMVAQVLGRWGTGAQQKQWLPKLASGETVAAFALSEPEAGSDAGAIQTAAVLDQGTFGINGTKTWTSFGLRADLYLVFVRCGGRVAAVLVERERPGLSVTPVAGMSGFRAAQMARLEFKDCRVPETNLVGRVGFGLSHIAGAGLDYGRHCVAWGGVGLAQACLDASVAYATRRVQFGKPLKEHPLIQEMLANMFTQVQAARALCWQEAYLRQTASPSAILQGATAKYFASRVAVQAASDAVQIHGANGFSRDYPVQRYFRDAKVLEVIEGSSQMHQMMIARNLG